MNYATLGVLTGMTKASANTRFLDIKKHAKELKERGEAVIEYNPTGGGTAKKEGRKGPGPKLKRETDFGNDKVILEPADNNGVEGPSNMHNVSEYDYQSAQGHGSTTANSKAASKTPRKKSNAGTKEPAAVKPKTKSKATTPRLSTIKVEQPESETEAGTQADEEDNTGSGAITDASPAAPKRAGLMVETPSHGPNARLYSSSGESDTSTVQVEKKNATAIDNGNEDGAKSSETAAETTPTGKKRARSERQKKTASPAPSDQSSDSDHQTSTTPSKRLKETSEVAPNAQISTPSAKAFKRGSVNNPTTPSASKAMSKVEYMNENIKNPAHTTDGVYEVDEGMHYVAHRTVGNPNNTSVKGGFKAINHDTNNDEEIARRANAVAQDRLNDMLVARRLNVSVSVPSPSPSSSSSTDTGSSKGATDTKTSTGTIELRPPPPPAPPVIAAARIDTSIPAPTTSPSNSTITASTSAATSKSLTPTLSSTHSPTAYERKPFKLTPSRPLSQPPPPAPFFSLPPTSPTATAAATSAVAATGAKEIVRPRTPTPSSASSLRVMDVGRLWRNRKGRGSQSASSAAAKGGKKAGSEDEGEGEQDTIRIAVGRK